MSDEILYSGSQVFRDNDENDVEMARHDPGYIPGGAAKLAEKILAEGVTAHEDLPPWGSGKKPRPGHGLPEGYDSVQAARRGGA